MREINGVLASVGYFMTAPLSTNGEREVKNEMNQQASTSTETIEVGSRHLVEKVKELVHEGNVRRIIIKDSDDHTVMELPVTVGVVGGVIGVLAAPTLTAIGAIAAIAADYSIEVEREPNREPLVAPKA